MEGGTSKSLLKHEDSQISPESSVAENSYDGKLGFEQFVNEVIRTTTKECDRKKSYYLRTKLTELSSMHTVLENEHRLLNEKVITDEQNVKETNELLLKQILEFEKEVVSKNEKITRLKDENIKLKVEIQATESNTQEAGSESSQKSAGSNVHECWPDLDKDCILLLNYSIKIEKSKVVRLEKQQNELQVLVADANFKVKSMEEELEADEKKLSISRSTISQLKQDQVDQELLTKRIDSDSKSIHDLQEKIATAMSVHEDQTRELNTKLDDCKCEMTQMAVMNRLKEDVWNIDVGKLKVQLGTKEKSFKDLIKRLNVLKSEKDSIRAQVNTLQQERYPKDDLIKELETRLNSLQVVHAEVCSVVEDAEKVNNEVMLKMSELKGKVAKEDTLNGDIGRLNMELREKCQVVEALNKNMDALKLEKAGIKAQLDTLHAEKCHQDNVIRELKIRLDSIQVEHVGVLSSFDNAQKDANELKLKVAELEREVSMQKEVISDREEEKREAIRQLSFSLEHYMSGYKELRQAFVSSKRHAVLNFLF